MCPVRVIWTLQRKKLMRMAIALILTKTSVTREKESKGDRLTSSLLPVMSLSQVTNYVRTFFLI